MAIELGGIQLNRVHRIVTLEHADWVTHRLPGLDGSLVQDLGRDTVRLQINGIFYGAAASQDLDALRKIYKNREPVDFVAEIVGGAYFSQVILEQFEVWQQADAPAEFGYQLAIAEYVPPPSPPLASLPKINQAIATDAANLLNVDALADALQMGSLPEITNPVAPLKTALDPVKSATANLDSITQGLKMLLGG